MSFYIFNKNILDIQFNRKCLSDDVIIISTKEDIPMLYVCHMIV